MKDKVILLIVTELNFQFENIELYRMNPYFGRENSISENLKNRFV